MSEKAHRAVTSLGNADERWIAWQREVLQVIQADFHGVFDRIGWDDIDWEAWRPLYDQAYSATDAVHSAFGKVA